MPKKVTWKKKIAYSHNIDQVCQELTDSGYWIYGVYTLPRYEFVVLACNNFSNE